MCTLSASALSSRLLTKSASGVLASLRGPTYGTEYASPLHSLRLCWTAFLNSLRYILMVFVTFGAISFSRPLHGLSTHC